MKIFYLFCLCLLIINAQDIDEIINAMTEDQKIGQTIQVDFIYFNDQNQKTNYTKIKELHLGSVLVGGNGCPIDDDGNISASDLCKDANNAKWRIVADKAKQQGVEVTIKDETYIIEPLLGTDAIRGNQHSVGEILFPHNIGLAASHNVDNFKNAAEWARRSVLESGFNFVFAPTVAVSHNPQWGRYYETLGTDPELIYQYAKAYVESSQDMDENGNINGVLTSVKHFIGDGATLNGCEEGDSIVDQESMEKFIEHNLQGYLGAVEGKTGNVMISYDAINGLAMSIHPFVNDILKKETRLGGLGFEGFVISDYNSVIKTAEVDLPRESEKITLEDAYAESFNIGVDMQMLSGGLDTYIPLLKDLLNQGKISQERLDDAIRRILKVKQSMGLIYKKNDGKKQKNINQDKDQEYRDALQAAQQSFVLLKNLNNDTLPKNATEIQNIILLGERYVPMKNNQHKLFQDYNNIGAQNGGWTIRWQGYNGNDYWMDDLKNQSKATSILDALKSKFPDANIYHPEYSDYYDYDQILIDRATFRNLLINKQNDFSSQNTIVITVLAENPYAEYMGDINCGYCQTQDQIGCLYNYHDNEYLPTQQSKTLEIKSGTYEKSIINLLKGRDPNISVITILFSGRPMIITDPLKMSDAFIAAWLPGTTGGDALVSSIFGDYEFDGQEGQFNRLPSPWIANMAQIQDFPQYKNNQVPEIDEPLFPAGYGKSTIKKQQIQ